MSNHDDIIGKTLRGPPGIRGPKGDKGDRGPMGLEGPEGPEGPQGEQGIQGFEGPAGPRGPMGLEGEAGKHGKDGKPGGKGERGSDGRDGQDADFTIIRPIAKVVVEDHEKRFDHTLINPFIVGSKKLSEAGMKDGMVITFDEKNDKLIYTEIKQVASKINRLAGRGLSLPSQSGNSGKFLTTDGSHSSWATVNTQVDIGDPIGLSANGSVLFVESGNLAGDQGHFFYSSTSTELQIGELGVIIPASASLSIWPQNGKTYGLYIDDASGSPTYSFYNKHTAPSRFVGNLGLHAESPNAYLTLGAGTASVNTAPLKFTSGTLLATPDNGAVEFLNDRIYISAGATRYPILVGGTGLGFTGGTTLIGGTDATDDLILRSTSGNATSGSDIIFQTGNNGATEGARLLFDGTFALFGVGIAAPTSFLHVNGVAPASVAGTGTTATAITTILGPTGGATSGTSSPTGGVGSLFTITAGAGGTANSGTSGTATGGAGGAGTVKTGAGASTSHTQASTVAKGGAGGQMNVNSGAGGSGTNSGNGGSTGGAAGPISIIASGGGSATGNGSGTITGGAGGGVTITAGSGGNATNGSSRVQGAGGNVSISAGGAGADSSNGGSGLAGGTITITSGTGGSTSNGTGGAGGATTISTGTGASNTSGGTAGAGGQLNLNAGSGGGGSATTPGVGGAISLIAGTGGSVSTTGAAGGAVTLSGGSGAAASSTNGGGGNISLNGGAGAGSGSNAGAAGGTNTVTGGTGGQSSSSTAGGGGNTTITGGTGGSPTSGSASSGAAGTLTVRGGTGGGQSGVAVNGAAGGLTTVSGGTGGPTSTQTSGAGGELRITGGVAGSNSGGSSGAGGIITFQTAVTTSLATCGNIDKNGRWFLGGATTATAILHLVAGSSAASTAPLKFTSGTLMATAEAGAQEFLTDDFFCTITTGAARKAFVLDDGTRLTSGRVPFASTNGRLIDDADFTFATDTLTSTKIVASTSLNVTGSLQCDTITNDTGLAAGVYSPTRSAESNLDSNVTMSEAQYMRVGNTVTVSGQFTADPTAASAASFEITLPVASNIGAVEDCAGTAVSGAIAGMCAAISGSVANNTAVFSWIATDVTSKTWSYQFSYQVI